MASPGEIWKLDTGEPRAAQAQYLRVLLADEFEVFYEAWDLPTRTGSLARARNVIYYRMPTALLVTHGSVVDGAPLTASELARERPDLPMRLLRGSGWSWTTEDFPTLEAFDQAFRSSGATMNLPDSARLLPLSIRVCPQRKHRGSTMAGRVISPMNADGFSPLELMWRAQQIQSAIELEGHEGAGLYRLGRHASMATFYTGGDIDQAGNAPLSGPPTTCTCFRCVGRS